MKRTIAIVLIVAGVLLLAGSAMALTLNERSETTHPKGEITAVVIENENGDVTIRAGDDTEVTRTERWNFVRPDYSDEVEDGTLTIRTGCTSMLVFNNCAVELSLVVPEDINVAMKSTNGDIDIAELESDEITVSTTNGDVDMNDTLVDVLAVSSSNGDLTIEDLTSGSLRATTTNGDIDMALADVPDDVTLSSTNGDIDAALPAGTYDIRTRTTNGDVSVDDDLDDDDDATTRVTVATTNGDIDLRSRS